MNLEVELKLSYYKEIADVDHVHKVKLVQHTESGKIFVLKTLKVYDIRVFQYLAANPIPGTPRIVELIEDGNLLYVVEEYISGTSLRDRLEESGTFCEEEAVKLIRQLCSILRPLHNLNPPIVHRDIKPSNIIISLDGKIVLVDFNSAKTSEYTQTQDTVLIGTVGYAAPEQYGFSASRPTTDIYAIGVLLNELLTGKLPNEEIYSGYLEPVIRKCLQMDPLNRYQSVEELLRAIQPAVKMRIDFIAHIRDWLPRGVDVRNRLPPGLNVQKWLPLWLNVRKWLPPGLRNRNPGIILLSVIWYLSIIDISLTLEVEDAVGGALYLNRFFFSLIFLSQTLWFGNYQNVWSYLPLSKSQNRFVRIIGVAIWSFALIFALMLALEILLDIAYR